MWPHHMARKRDDTEPEPASTWGGRREGAGRKKVHKGAMNHVRREDFSARHPVHVLVRLLRGLPSLQSKKAYDALFDCFQKGCQREGFRIAHWSIQRNHLHLIVEASGTNELARGMQGLLIRIAKRLNKTWERSGSIFADRYHHSVAKTAREARNLLCYVLNNSRHHGSRARGPCRWSSAFWFDAWLQDAGDPPRADPDPPVARPRTTLLSSAWKRFGLIGFDECPEPQRPSGKGGEADAFYLE